MKAKEPMIDVQTSEEEGDSEASKKDTSMSNWSAIDAARRSVGDCNRDERGPSVRRCFAVPEAILITRASRVQGL